MEKGRIVRISETHQGLPSGRIRFEQSTRKGSLRDRMTCLLRAICIAAAVFLGAGLGTFPALGDENPLLVRFAYGFGSPGNGWIEYGPPIANGITFSGVSLHNVSQGLFVQGAETFLDHGRSPWPRDGRVTHQIRILRLRFLLQQDTRWTLLLALTLPQGGAGLPALLCRVLARRKRSNLVLSTLFGKTIFLSLVVVDILLSGRSSQEPTPSSIIRGQDGRNAWWVGSLKVPMGTL